MNTKQRFGAVQFFMDYEGGDISEDEMIDGFQELVNSGLAWQLQGHYGRMAAALIEAGLIRDPRGQDDSIRACPFDVERA